MYWLWQNKNSFLDHHSLPLNATLTPFINNRENAIHLDIPCADMFGPVNPIQIQHMVFMRLVIIILDSTGDYG